MILFNSGPKGEITLSYMDSLMMDFFLFFKRSNVKNQIFTHWICINSRVYLSGMNMGVNKVFTLLFTGKHNWCISLFVNCKIKFC